MRRKHRLIRLRLLFLGCKLTQYLVYPYIHICPSKVNYISYPASIPAWLLRQLNTIGNNERNLWTWTKCCIYYGHNLGHTMKYNILWFGELCITLQCRKGHLCIISHKIYQSGTFAFWFLALLFNSHFNKSSFITTCTILSLALFSIDTYFFGIWHDSLIFIKNKQ